MRPVQRTIGDLFELPDVVVALLALIAITTLGVLGFVWIEGFTWLDALYMTVITLSTVGFGEVRPLSDNGQLFAILLIVLGVGVAVTMSGRLAQGLIDLRLGRLFPRRTMHKAIEELREHVIVCGYGRFGRMLANDLREADVSLVVVEVDPDQRHQLERDDHLFLLGSAASDELLEYAGVKHARAVAAATGSDADNVFITLAAKQLNPDVNVFARGETQATLDRLQFAGATKAISAYHLGAQRMAASIVRPAVVEFLEVARPALGAEIDLEEVLLAEGSSLCGRTLASLEEELERVRIVGLGAGGGDIVIAPRAHRELGAGDRLLAVGVRTSLEQLAALASG